MLLPDLPGHGIYSVNLVFTVGLDLLYTVSVLLLLGIMILWPVTSIIAGQT